MATLSIEDLALQSFARSTLNLLTFWPALRLAMSQGWGSSTGLTHLAEDVVDLFYTTAIQSQSSSYTTSSSATLVPEQDDVEAVLLHVLSHEFSITLEDNSEAVVARDLTALWRECVGRAMGEPIAGGGEGLVEKFERAAAKARQEDGVRGYEAQREGNSDEESGSDSGSDTDSDGMDEDGDEEMAEPRGSRREAPVVDEDGFQMVPKKGGRR